MILKGAEKKVYHQEYSGLKKHGSKFPEFLFCLTHPKVKALKASTWNYQQMQDKEQKQKQKSLFL